MRSRRSVLPSLLAGLALCALLQGCGREEAESVGTDRRVPVITGVAESRRVVYTLNQVGTLEASQEVTLRSEVEGAVEEILFTQGEEAEKGKVLVRLRTEKTEAELRRLEARIDQLRVRLQNRKSTLERYRPLVEQDLVSRLQFDDLETEIKEIESEIAQTFAMLAREEDRLADAAIRAPFHGTLGARNFSVGDYLQVGDPVVSLVDMDSLEISFQVPEKFKEKIRIGQSAVVTVDAYPDRRFQGAIFFISPQTDLQTRSFRVKARLDNEERLLNPGMFARVELITDVHENARTVPWESVIQTEEGAHIYTVRDGVARKVPIVLGKVTSEWAEALEADLAPGTPVILEGKYAVQDGMKVSMAEEAAAGGSPAAP